MILPLYPDNKNRMARATQLVNDCASLSAQLKNDKHEIEEKMTAASKAIKEAYSNLAKDEIPFEEVELSEGWFFQGVRWVNRIVTYPLATMALHAAMKSFLLSQGRIGEAGFADLVGLPRWFTAGKMLGGFAAQALVSELIDAVEGDSQRDELRKAIHSLIEPRIKLKRNEMINAAVKESLHAVLVSCDAVKSIPGLSKEQLDSMIQNLLQQHHVKLEAITEEVAKEALRVFDEDRKSWTNEDK